MRFARPLLARTLPAAALCLRMSMATSVTNPLLADWSRTEPYGLPPFGKIQPDHFKP